MYFMWKAYIFYLLDDIFNSWGHSSMYRRVTDTQNVFVKTIENEKPSR